MSRLAFNSLSPPSFTEAGCPFVMAVPWAKGLLLLSGHWLPMLHAAPEVSPHSNPCGTHLHLFRQGLFFSVCVIIVWEAAAKSCANVTCTFLVNEELSSCYRSRLCTSMYLFIPLTDRYGTSCTRLSREHVYSLTVTHRQMYSLSETEETVFPEINTSPIYPVLPYSCKQRPGERDEIVTFPWKPRTVLAWWGHGTAEVFTGNVA